MKKIDLLTRPATFKIISKKLNEVEQLKFEVTKLMLNGEVDTPMDDQTSDHKIFLEKEKLEQIMQK